MAGDLTFGGVPLGDPEPLRRAELLRDRTHPLGELLEARASGHRLTPLEVDQLARQPMPDRSPEILLQQARRQVGQRLALVERARDPRGQRVAQGRERA